MILIDGKKEAAELREKLKKEVLDLKKKYNKVPGLTVILVGDLTPSQIYVRNKEKSANEVGLKSDVIKYPDTVKEKIITKPEVLHAESNAISKLAKSTQSSDGATLYVTCSPCLDCSKLIIQAGIIRVVYSEQYRIDDGLKLLKKADIELKYLCE